MQRTFLNISQQECGHSSNRLINNSLVHYKAAELLASHQYYGMAISHLVLSTEELIKAIILALDSKGLRVRSGAKMKKFFTQHQIRHVSSLILNLALFSSNIFNNLFKEIFSKQSSPLYTELLKAIFLRDAEKIEIALNKIEVELGFTQREAFLFWHGADSMKQAGFYVDYDNGLRDPNEISSQQYLKARLITTHFHSDCNRILKVIQESDVEDKDILERFGKLFNDISQS